MQRMGVFMHAYLVLSKWECDKILSRSVHYFIGCRSIELCDGSIYRYHDSLLMAQPAYGMDISYDEIIQPRRQMVRFRFNYVWRELKQFEFDNIVWTSCGLRPSCIKDECLL